MYVSCCTGIRHHTEPLLCWCMRVHVYGKFCECCFQYSIRKVLSLLQAGAKGHQVLNRVFDHLDLLEKDYFGLRYLDDTTQTVNIC